MPNRIVSQQGLRLNGSDFLKRKDSYHSALTPIGEGLDASSPIHFSIKALEQLVKGLD